MGSREGYRGLEGVEWEYQPSRQAYLQANCCGTVIEHGSFSQRALFLVGVQ